MDAFTKIAEQRIKEAQERGEFDHLPGQGRPLDLEDYFRGPEDLRMAYRILKNAGCLPPELMLKNEIQKMEDMLATMKDEQEKYRQLKKLNLLVTRLNLMRPRPVDFEEQQRYFPRVVSKISIPPKKD
ncbi:MAG: DnaJ family domain-containing protein [Thermodesulfobacteriota bacterium]